VPGLISLAVTTAHVTALYGAFLAAAIASGTDPTPAVLVSAFGSDLCAELTHYASGPAPVHFGSGYTTMGEWWRLDVPPIACLSCLDDWPGHRIPADMGQ
jgi:di/tricarboxylate transporter